MDKNRRRLKSAELWCLVLLILNVATAATDFYFRRSALALIPLPPGQAVSGMPGVATGGSPRRSNASCHLLRYASSNCGFCSPKYSQSWNDLEQTLTRKGCDAVIVSPYAGDLPLEDRRTPEQRLAGVSLQFVKSTRFNSTPITLLLDRDWRIIWSHVGTLDSNDYREAVRLAGF